MSTMTRSTLVGTDLPLPHLGLQHTGTVVAESWSPALGRILRVQENNNSNMHSTLLIYGDHLHDALLELSQA